MCFSLNPSILELDSNISLLSVPKYLIFEKVNQTKASIQFNVTPSNIQQILAKSHYYAFKEAFDAVNVIFSEVNHNVRF